MAYLVNVKCKYPAPLGRGSLNFVERQNAKWQFNQNGFVIIQFWILPCHFWFLNFKFTAVDQYFSQEGLDKLKEELKHRVEILRPEIAIRVKEAKELGDLSENAEYDAAKDAQAANEGRVEEVKDILENAVIITNTNGSGIVSVGSSVKVESKNGVQTFVIVGAAESDPAQGFISNESPLGVAFLGHKKEDEINAKTPKGIMEYKILEVK